MFALWCAAALANPHPLPMTYGYATLPKNGVEIEQFVDATPVPAYDATGTLRPTPRANLVTELEYGLTDRVELGLYWSFVNDPGAGTGQVPLLLEGLKQRLRWRLAEPGRWPVDLSVYVEISELSNEFEIEGKLNLERRLGPVLLQVNLWGEREFYFDGTAEWVLHPTAGAAFELAPSVSLGLEGWLNAEYGAPTKVFNNAPHVYLGPTLMLQQGRLWWAAAPYVRLDEPARGAALGDRFGRLWVRSAVGLDL